ncbi:MAG: hypothetical protein KDA52_07540 [Planctomycetaceae bacterium]|nr:hypothetical protein [Planctomycetaceae bacterium]
MKCLTTLFLSTIVFAADPAPESLYEDLVTATKWRDQLAAAHSLGDLGEAGLPSLIKGAQHENEKVQDWCYRELFEKFTDHEQTVQAVLRGLDDDSHRIRYTCCFFAGTQKIEAARDKLREIYQSSEKDLKLTCAKSLAELGETDVIRTLYYAAESNWYMERYQANVGLKALSGRDLNDFADETDGYQWGEGAFVSGGEETRMMLHPIADAELKAGRYTALAAWARWPKAERSKLYAELDPNIDRLIEQLKDSHQGGS